MPALNVLVVDDELASRQILATAVAKAGHSVETAGDVAGARSALARADVDVVLCDIQLPDGDGIDVVRQVRAAGKDTIFVMVTAFASVETAVEALRAGAYDYIIKPVRHAELVHRLSQIEAMCDLRQENRALRRAARESKGVYEFSSPAMRGVERLIDKVARTDSTVLISGESGTGKTVVARAVHERSLRHDRPFMQINCGAIPEQLLESEFFGHTRGAFTSADHARKGLFLEAEGGTLFLDEIGDLPAHMQTKLLHVIEDKHVRPLGSGQARRVDVRIVAASNRDLDALVAGGGFREDLFFRLSMFRITLPPLRERRDDIRGLIDFVLRANQRGAQRAEPFELDPEAESILLAYPWKGNVRELENVINRACILVEGNSISVDTLPAELIRAVGTTPLHAVSESAGATLSEQRRSFEEQLIRRAVADAGGDRRLAAQRLGISLSSLYRKLDDAVSP
jgi:two-component system response regulator AtoC